MKLRPQNFFMLAVLSLSLLLPHFAQAFGNEGPSGGDEVGLEFQAAYKTALEDIHDHDGDLYAKITPSGLIEKIDSVRVVVVEEPLFVTVGDQKQESAAVNDPSVWLILVNRMRWKQIGTAMMQRSLALHEVLSLAGLEGSGRYPISSLYLTRNASGQDGQGGHNGN